MSRRVWLRAAALVAFGLITGCGNSTAPDSPKPTEEKTGKPVKPKLPRVPKS